MLEILSSTAPGTQTFRHPGTFDRTLLTVSYRVDLAEHERRLTADLGAVVDEFLLAALMTLPERDLGLVSRRFERVVRKSAGSALATLVEDPEGGLWGQRRLGIAVEVDWLHIDSVSWARGRDTAHNWVGYGPRVVRTPEELTQFELTEAAHYGIGVEDAYGKRLLEPGTYAPQRWSSARWRFSEMVYRQFRELSD